MCFTGGWYQQQLQCSVMNFFLPHETQAPKCADIWPIENVWAIIKQDLAQVSVTTIPEMKKQIIKVWQRLMLTKNCVTI